MGMFDYVDYEAPCPKCGVIVINWQTKEGNCLLETVKPEDVSYFLGNCGGCNAFIDASVQKENGIVKVELSAAGEQKTHVISIKEADNFDTKIIAALENQIRIMNDFIKLLGEELDELVPLATVHGWKSSRFEKGKKLREEIDKFKKE